MLGLVEACLGLGNRISFGVWGGGGGGDLAILILVIKIILAIILRSGYYSGCRNPNNLFGGYCYMFNSFEVDILPAVVTEIFSVWP